MFQPILGISKEFVSAQVAVQSFTYACMRITRISRINMEILLHGFETWLKNCWVFPSLNYCEIDTVKTC